MGLLYNSITKTIDSENIYTSGRYYVWIFHHFIAFPATLKTIEFSSLKGASGAALTSRTAEGLAIDIHLSFQYQLIKQEIPKLYAMSNQDYETTFIRIARDVILQAAGRYQAPQYWKNRQVIAEEMQKELNIELQKAHAYCKKLQILKLDLPDSYEKSIVDTQVEVQNKQMKKYEQEAEIIRQRINILRSENQRSIRNISSSATAEAYFIRQNASAVAINNTLGAEADAFKLVSEELGLKGDDLNKYIYYNSFYNKTEVSLAVGFQNGILNLQKKRTLI